MSYINFNPFAPSTKVETLKTSEYPGPLSRYDLILERIRENDKLHKNDSEIINQTNELQPNF